MSFTDFSLIALQRPQGAAELRRAGELRPDRRRPSSRSRTSSSCAWSCSTSGGRFSNVVIHVILGVLIALLLNTKGLLLPRVLPRAVHPAGRHPADHRRDGLAEHVRRRTAAPSTTPLQAVGGLFEIPADASQPRLAAPAGRSRSRSSRCRSPTSRCSPRTPGSAGRSTAVVATGALQSIPRRPVRGGRDGRRELVAEVPHRHDRRSSARRCCRTRSTASSITFNLFFLLVLHDRRRAVRPNGDPRHPGVSRSSTTASSTASRRRSPCYLFFLLLAHHPGHQPDPQGHEELCRLTAAHRPGGPSHECPQQRQARPDFTAYFGFGRRAGGELARGGEAAAAGRQIVLQLILLVISVHGAVPDHLDLQHLHRPARPVPAGRPEPDPAGRDAATRTSRSSPSRRATRSASWSWRSTAS